MIQYRQKYLLKSSLKRQYLPFEGCNLGQMLMELTCSATITTQEVFKLLYLSVCHYISLIV
jgi:hypothetical protein